MGVKKRVEELEGRMKRQRKETKEKMIEKKNAKNMKEREGRQTSSFQGLFCSSKAVNTFTLCFPSPSLLTGLCTQRSRKEIMQELLEIHLDAEQRCPERKETA